MPIHSRKVSRGIVGHTTQTCIPGACILACTILSGEGGEGGRATQQSFKCGGSPHTATHEILIQLTPGDSNPLQLEPPVNSK